MSGPITSMIIPDIMIDPIIRTMPYTVGLAHTVIGLVIRFVVGFVIGLMISLVVGFVISLVVGFMVGPIIGPVAATFTTA